jgi:hypothetical protein
MNRVGDMKTCSRCHVTQVVAVFGSNAARPDGLDEQCRPCRAAYGREWRAAHPETRARYVATTRSHPEFKEKARAYALSRAFGLTVAGYNNMVLTQCGLCAICGKAETRVHKATGEPFRLTVHHNHETGRVIALLCAACNTGMGQLGDSPALMRRAADIHEDR